VSAERPPRSRRVAERLSRVASSIRATIRKVHMGLIELLIIVLVVAAIAGGIGVSPLLWLLLLVALVLMLTGGGFGYGRGSRL
jgi:uncharacterized membrane protein YjdF